MWLGVIARPGVARPRSNAWRCAAWIALALAAAACSPPLPPQFPGGVEVALWQSKRGTLFVEVIANGQPRRFIVDTGASITAVTPSAARELRLAATGETIVNDDVEALVARMRTLSVGNAHHTNVRVAIVLLPAAKEIGERFDGILGLDILGQYDVVIDLVRHRLALHPAGHVAGSASVRGMVHLPFQKARHGLVQVEAVLDDYPPIPAILDLGAQHTTVNSATARMLEGVNTKVLGWRPRAIRVGELVIHDLEKFFMPVSDLPMFRGWGYARTPAILLGADLFTDRALVLSYRDGSLYVSR